MLLHLKTIAGFLHLIDTFYPISNYTSYMLYVDNNHIYKLRYNIFNITINVSFFLGRICFQEKPQKNHVSRTPHKYRINAYHPLCVVFSLTSEVSYV